MIIRRRRNNFLKFQDKRWEIFYDDILFFFLLKKDWRNRTMKEPTKESANNSLKDVEMNLKIRLKLPPIPIDIKHIYMYLTFTYQ